MLSRVANSIYWLSRYVERAENVARFLDVNFNLSLGKGEPIREQWAPLVSITGDDACFRDLYATATRQNVLHFLTLDRRNPNSIASCVERARENARSIREVVPTSIWEQVNRFYHLIHSARVEELTDPSRFCEQVKIASHVINGMSESTMSHGEEYHFTRLGRMIERADKTSRIVDVQYYLLLPNLNDVGSAIDTVRWMALLKSTTALSRYRQLHGNIVPAKVADLLVLDRHFPRSIHFCLVHAQASLHAITGTAMGTYRLNSEQLLGRMRAEFDYTGVDEIIGRGLHEFVVDFQDRLNMAGTFIHQDFFTIPPVHHPDIRPNVRTDIRTDIHPNVRTDIRTDSIGQTGSRATSAGVARIDTAGGHRRDGKDVNAHA